MQPACPASAWSCLVQVNHHWDSRYFVVKTSISHRTGWTFVKLAVEESFWALPPPRDTHRDLAAVFNEAFLAPRRSGADIYVFVKSYSTEQFLGECWPVL